MLLLVSFVGVHPEEESAEPGSYILTVDNAPATFNAMERLRGDITRECQLLSPAAIVSVHALKLPPQVNGKYHYFVTYALTFAARPTWHADMKLALPQPIRDNSGLRAAEEHLRRKMPERRPKRLVVINCHPMSGAW